MKQLVALIGYLEGFSFLILIGIAMPMKYIGGNPEMVSLMGAIHGGLFVAFLGILFIGAGKHWTFQAVIHGFIASIVPAGPFLFEGMLEFNQRLDQAR